MADHFAWDSFMYEIRADGRQRMCDRISCGENDIRHERFDLDRYDAEDWCGPKHFFWTPQEAALISFYRDPSKVWLNEDKDFVFDDDFMGPMDNGEDGVANKALRQRIDDLHDMILDAQDTKDLPLKIRREVYVEWCKLIGVDFPQSVVEQLKAYEEKLKAFDLKRDCTGNPARLTYDHLPETAADLPHKKARGPQSQLEAKQRTIILSLLIKGKLFKRDTGALSKKLCELLDARAAAEGDPRLRIDDGTIKTRLDEAHALLNVKDFSD